jgi:cryptochrome
MSRLSKGFYRTDMINRLSCTAFFSQFYRCYSPISFPKKWDANGDFVRKYVPELAKYDKKYIYEPHKAPIADQKKWGCLIKGDGTDQKDGQLSLYPKAMFDFNERRQHCIDKMKEAYEMKLYGDNEKVMNGKWKAAFEFDDKGAKRKDEANGDLKGGKPLKRSRDDEPTSDDGADADAGDDSDRGPPQKASKKGKGPGQGTLDGMVSRRKP